ncbi:hypothetical protein [Burkholderia gladioli]|uniref:hypothetical protein n=1 Tax=Burkholderia gladioli TaxID=28095 RepID=UPI00163F6093|nr:hypothetical protein [Burkholderia gladioli]
MKWLIDILRKIMNGMSSGAFGRKPSRPQILKIWIPSIIDGEIFQTEHFIITLNGKTLDAPLFSSRKEAEDYLDKYYPTSQYNPE